MQIIGYTYEADLHCVDCAVNRFGRLPPAHETEASSYGYVETLSDGSHIDLDENKIATDQQDNEGNPIHFIFSTDEQLETPYCGDCHEKLATATRSEPKLPSIQRKHPMKYIKGDQTYPLKGLKLTKLSLTDDKGFTETPWALAAPDGTHFVLQNHALAFTPHESWGAIMPSQHFNFLAMLKAQKLTLHPEAWDEYLKKGIIDERGKYILKR